MTRLPPRKIIPLIAFGALMAGAIPVNWSFLQAEASKLGLIDRDLTRIAKGKFTEELTAKYNESSPFRDFGIEAFGSLSYFAFNEARSGAQISASGVLFSNEEFETGPKTPERIEKAVKHIAAVHQALKARGIDLIIAPLPLKADIDRADLDPLQLPAELAGRYDSVAGKLRAAGVPLAPIRASFMEANEKTPVFLASDTHWTPDGAAAAAAAIASLAKLLDLPAPQTFILKESEKRLHEGDLRKFVRLFPSLESAGPRHDLIAKVTVEAEGASDAGLFGDAAIPVVLIGTSYSANAAFGFEAHLKAALQRDVLNLSEEGKGPFAPMTAFLKSDVLTNSPPKLVIWEMPIRYLDDVFPEEQFKFEGTLP